MKYWEIEYGSHGNYNFIYIDAINVTKIEINKINADGVIITLPFMIVNIESV